MTIHCHGSCVILIAFCCVKCCIQGHLLKWYLWILSIPFRTMCRASLFNVYFVSVLNSAVYTVAVSIQIIRPADHSLPLIIIIAYKCKCVFAVMWWIFATIGFKLLELAEASYSTVVFLQLPLCISHVIFMLRLSAYTEAVKHSSSLLMI